MTSNNPLKFEKKNLGDDEGVIGSHREEGSGGRSGMGAKGGVEGGPEGVMVKAVLKGTKKG